MAMSRKKHFLLIILLDFSVLCPEMTDWLGVGPREFVSLEWHPDSTKFKFDRVGSDMVTTNFKSSFLTLNSSKIMQGMTGLS